MFTRFEPTLRLTGALALPEVKQRLENLGYDIVASPPDVFAAYIKTEIAKWAKVVKASGARAE